MTNRNPTRLTTEDLDKHARFIELLIGAKFSAARAGEVLAVTRQAAHDARVLQQLRAWLENEKRGDWMLDISPAMVQRVLAKLTELETDR